MTQWKNLDTLASFGELAKVQKVNLVEAMSGQNGADRVKKYSVPMAEGLTYNYAAKQVDDQVIDALEKLAAEAEKAVSEMHHASAAGIHQISSGTWRDHILPAGIQGKCRNLLS